MSGPYQYTHWAWTLHDKEDKDPDQYLPGEQDIIDILHESKVGITFCIFSQEMCSETGRLHYQGYLQLASKKTMVSIKEAFGFYHWVNLSQARLSSTHNIEYCQKRDHTHIDGPWQFGQPRFLKGWTEQNSGKRKREEVPVYVRDYTLYPPTPRQVHWFIGPAFLGKTPRAKELIKKVLGDTDDKHIYEIPSIATRNGARWIGDEYQHEPGVLFDEFDFHSHHPDQLKMLLDIYPHKVATRFGGMGNLLWDPRIIVLTSNTTREEMARLLQRDWLRKRLTAVYDLWDCIPREHLKTAEELTHIIKE